MTHPPISIVLADDERMVRTALRAILCAEEDLRITGEAATGAEAVSLVRAVRPDIVLMDVRMPDIDGIRATEQILATPGERPRIIVLTTFENDSHVFGALRAGAAGFLLKRTDAPTLVQAVRLLARSDTLLFPSAVRALAAQHARAHPAPPPWAARLTEREADVLRLLATGFTNAEIAARLLVAPATVKTHVASLLAKTGSRDRTQAAVRAYEAGFVPPEP
ncbi:response regulator transcription factor [Streptomyces sp. NPDC002734]|uniref:response regulator transcription factor n=1 Tax=Streptomyces sp. NPDC002734 TaxID=3154426 RepID=UPI00332573D8